MLGFAKSCNAEVANLQKITTPKGEYFSYDFEQGGRKTKELLAEIFQAMVRDAEVARPMRWGNHLFAFARPAHWCVLLFGKDVIAAEILNVKSASTTYGHRFLAPQPIKLKKPQDYERQLNKAYVIADFAQRKALIKTQVEDLAKKNKLQVKIKDSLLNQVTSLVEWPVALLGEFDSKFLDVPQECLISSMEVNQKYFAILIMMVS